MSSASFTPGPTPNTVCAADGKVLTVPEGWVLAPPGDPALTRRIKAAGDHFAVAEKKGRKVFSRGIWTSAATVERIRAALQAERSTESFAKKKEADARRRGRVQADYVEDFFGAVLEFLAFHPSHAEVADRLARAVTDHATPIGSGTVARTKRIPLAKRAEAAVIAWMRHQTTGYDSMAIPRIKGKRREVRRMLAHRSKQLLARYRPRAGATAKSSALEVEGFDRRHLVVCGTEGTFHIQPLDRPMARISLAKPRGQYKQGTQEVKFPPFTRYSADAADMARIIRGEKVSDFPPQHDLAVQEALLKACRQLVKD